jgi:PEP-CTERM motif
MSLTFKTAGAALGMAFAMSAIAAPISPTYNTFGPLPAATFGGTGIPNSAVAITTAGGLTLGMSAHQRFSGPDLQNNGAGTFSAPTGVSAVAPSTPADPYALWNFSFYISGANATMAFRLFYDFDPATGNDESTHGTISFPGSALPGGLGQNSWNLGMNFLAAAAAGIVPPSGAFDPNAAGQYTFALVAYDLLNNGREIGRSAIAVNVPEPGTFALAGLALLGLGAMRRRV